MAALLVGHQTSDVTTGGLRKKHAKENPLIDIIRNVEKTL